MDRADARNEDSQRLEAMSQLNIVLSREGFEAFYAPDGQCYLRHIVTNTFSMPAPNPHRPFTVQERDRAAKVLRHLETCSEDEVIEEILLPLFRQLGFERITATGHQDKALEYGKDLWMRYVLPTQHRLYFGVQVKKGKLDASGVSAGTNRNIAELHNQCMMMLGHEIFDPETSRRVLVDHAFIVSAGEITKSARNWLADKIDVSRRSQIMFIDSADLVNLWVVTNMPVRDDDDEAVATDFLWDEPF
jgi:hypothetical protein